MVSCYVKMVGCRLALLKPTCLPGLFLGAAFGISAVLGHKIFFGMSNVAHIISPRKPYFLFQRDLTFGQT